MQDGADRYVQVYPLDSLGGDVATVVMPWDAEIIDFAPYEGKPALWAIVELDKDTVLRRFQMVPTGWTIPAEGIYIGSMTLMRGDSHMPMHFFEVPVPLLTQQAMHMKEYSHGK